jgi:hypothetical protein
MQRGLENEFRVVTIGKHLPEPCDRACFYSMNQKLRPHVGFVFPFMSCKTSSATETLIGCTRGIGSKMICLEYSVFVLSKFIVLFHLHCLFCLVHYSLYAFFLSYAIATKGIEFDRKKVEGYIEELVSSSTLIVLFFIFFSVCI